MALYRFLSYLSHYLDFVGMHLLLKCKTWQLFVLLMSPRLLMFFFVNKPHETALLASVSAVLYFGFLGLSYEFLRPFETKSKPIQRVFFHLVNLIFIWIFVSLLLNGYSLNFLETVLVLPFFIVFISFLFLVLAKKLYRIEKERHLSTQTVFLYLLFFLFLPAGIWVIVPQFKRLKGV